MKILFNYLYRNGIYTFKMACYMWLHLKITYHTIFDQYQTSKYYELSLIRKWFMRCSVCLYLQLFVGELVSYLGYLCLLPFICIQNILCCVLVFLRLVYPMLPVSLDCPLLIAPSISSNVYFPVPNYFIPYLALRMLVVIFRFR